MVNKSMIPTMPIFEGKRLEFVGVKYNQAEKSALEEIAKKEDRPLSYIVRELSLRGLAQYKRDGSLKTTEAEQQLIKGSAPDTSHEKPKRMTPEEAIAKLQAANPAAEYTLPVGRTVQDPREEGASEQGNRNQSNGKNRNNES